METQYAIEVKNVYKQFKIEYDRAKTLKDKLLFWNRGKTEYHEVLKNINLNIKKGETVALIGVNGSGKSTLLKMMTKIIYPTKGSITTHGKLTSLLELGAGFHIDFTGRENIYFNASIFGLTRNEIDKRIDDIIEFSELGSAIDNPVRTYSSGMYMRLAFSVAINVDADILLIDEILAVGDQHFQEKCFNKLEELKNSDKTIVIVSHSLDVVKKLCDRAVWLYEGEVRADGKSSEVIEQYLDQVALDHMEERKKAIQQGIHKGMTYIDEPKNYQYFSNKLKSIESHGWMIADDSDAKLEIYLDDHRIDSSLIERYRRLDVYKAFKDDFSGLVDVDTLGWRLDLPIENVKIGKHYMKISCISHEGKELANTVCEIYIE